MIDGLFSDVGGTTLDDSSNGTVLVISGLFSDGDGATLIILVVVLSFLLVVYSVTGDGATLIILMVVGDSKLGLSNCEDVTSNCETVKCTL